MPIRFRLALFWFLASACALITTAAQVVNTTDCGPVQGSVSGDVLSFTGIPYAFATERWRESRPLPSLSRCWNGTLQPIRPPKCVQMSNGEGTEDCLFLNVFTPVATPSTQLLPVMVFIHGGDLTEGAAPGYSLAHALSLFIRESKPVVLVAIQYRLNAFGFLSVPVLSQADPRRITSSTGMYGIRDQQQALSWVQRNIIHFHGDTSKVTVFGQSSGGTSVFTLVASPASAGLFSRAISLSGSPNVTMDLATQQSQHSGIVVRMSCNKSTGLACMRNATTDEILAAIPQGPDHERGTRSQPSWTMDNIFSLVSTRDGARQPGLAVVDGDTLRQPLLHALSAADGVDVPLIVSSMAQENGHSPGDDVAGMSRQQFTTFLSQRYDSSWGEGFGEQLAAIYRKEIAEGVQKAYDTMSADQGMTCGNQAVARAAATGFQSPVYNLYFEAYNVSQRSAWAYHGYDLKLACFGESAVASRLRAIWFEFASTGEVRGWKPTVDKNGHARSIRFLPDGSTRVAESWRSEFCHFWQSHGAGPQFWWSN